MRIVLQRVARANVAVNGAVVGSIGKGLLLLVGFGHSDGDDAITWMADRVLGLRVFSDEAGKMNLSVQDVLGEILVVSQFTLYGDTRKGRRPSFVDAAPPDRAVSLYESFVRALEAGGCNVQTGEFGAMMEVSLVNDGPVTLILDR